MSQFKRLYEKYNGTTMHPYKINVMTFKTKSQLKKCTSCEELSKMQNRFLNQTSLSELYNTWNPTFILVTLNEIHVIKYYEEDDHYTLLYNGNIHKVLTTLTSIISIGSGMQWSGSFIEFDRDEDVLDFIQWKQHELYRNVLNFIWNREVEVGFTTSMSVIEKYVEDHHIDIPSTLKHGLFIKQFKDMDTNKNWCVLGKIESADKWVYYTTSR